MSYKYILTTRSFFEEGPCGRVSHAKGFVEGLVDNNETVTLVSGTGAHKYIKQNPNIALIEKNNFLFLFFFWETIKSISKKDKIVIRWRPALPFLFIVFAFFYKNMYFEVNSITGLDSRISIVRKIVWLSITLTAKYFKIIVVSQSSKNQIIALVPKYRSIYVMPNGFSAENLSQFLPYTDPNCYPNLVYFGRKQAYYEWENLYRIIKENSKINLHIFGFEDTVKADNIKFYGEFNHHSLVDEMNKIANPVLIIHPDDSEVAKSGSPMKLFEYAYLKIPVIVGDSLSEIGSDFDELVFYRSGSEESLKNTINQVIEDYSEYYNNAQSLRAKVEVAYSWKSIIHKWLLHEAI